MIFRDVLARFIQHKQTGPDGASTLTSP